MNTGTEFLRIIAEEIAARQNLAGLNEPHADHRLQLEAQRLEKEITVMLRSIDNFVQRDTFYNDTLAKLVDICDILFEVHHRVSPDTKVVLSLLTFVKQILPREVSPFIRLPKAFVFTQKEPMKTAWEEYDKTLHEQEIDPKLIGYARIPFQRFITGKEKLYWADYTWLKGYLALLAEIDWENADCNSKTEALMSLLIGRDFNHERFYVYCKKYIQSRVALGNTKDRRLQELAICEKLVIEDTQTGLPSFDRHANSVSSRLVKWIREETAAMKAGRGEEYIGKLTVVWNIDTLAPFFKLLWDHKLFKETTLDLLSKQIAAGFSSNTKGDFQAKTVAARFYVTDLDVMMTLEAFLTELLEDVRRFTH